MFGPTKVSIMFDKTSAICGIGFVLATCACFMLKNAIEHFVHGRRKGSRLKGLILFAIACGFLTAGIVTILETQTIVLFLSEIAASLLEKLGR